MSQFTNPKRFYLIDKDRLALFQELTSGTNTVDGASSNYITIDTNKTVRVHGIARAEHFNTGSSAVTADYSSATAGPLGQIHQQFQEALVFKVISHGYEDPRNLNLELAQYFNGKYGVVIKEAKKFARSNYTRTGNVVPQDF